MVVAAAAPKPTGKLPGPNAGDDHPFRALSPDRRDVDPSEWTAEERVAVYDYWEATRRTPSLKL